MARILYLGIDPGKSGGLALIHPFLSDPVRAIPMPSTDRDIWEWFLPLGEWPDSRHIQQVAVIERVGGFIKGNPLPGSKMFNFGRNYGVLIGCLTAADIPFEEVTASKWQHALGIAPRKKTESRTAFKNRLKQKAQQLFPSVKVTLATADALLVTEYCRRKHEGKLQ